MYYLIKLAAALHICGLPTMYCLADVAIQQLLNIHDIYNVFKLTVIANVFNI